jgi:chemotaxis regulatin CheY-phosphate phosphatase CheZ
MTNEILMAHEYDGNTGEVTERLLTPEEVIEHETVSNQSVLEKEAREAERIAKEEAKANGMAKLIALGLTEEEAGALIG